MQNAQFIQNTLRVTQGPNSAYSHAGSQAVDFGGANPGGAGSVDKCYAPYDCRVVRLRTGANGECYIESLEEVRAANGRVARQNMLLMHAGGFRVKVGDMLRQGEYFYDEGGMQGGNPAALTPHVHVEGGFGPSPARQEKNARGTWVLPNQAPLHELLFVPGDVPITDGGGLAWKRAEANTAAGGSEAGDGTPDPGAENAGNPGKGVGNGNAKDNGGAEAARPGETTETARPGQDTGSNVAAKPGQSTGPAPAPTEESKEEQSMYRLYEVVCATEKREEAEAEFRRIYEAGGRPGLDFAASDGQYRVGNCIAAIASGPANLLQNLAPNRFIG